MAEAPQVGGVALRVQFHRERTDYQPNAVFHHPSVLPEAEMVSNPQCEDRLLPLVW